MNYVSLFTGIGGFDLAFNRAGHRCVAMCERDKAAQSVLRHRFPGVPLFDDVTNFGRKDIDEPVDIVVGGSPCQSFSVAGLRKSLADDRGNLAFEFCRIIAELAPRWVVWENVPGVLSTKDNAFGNFLAALVGEDAALVPPGKRWPNAGMVAGPARTAAWRILDAQYFGVAQRRRRVFVVAGAGTASAAPVLFESEGVRWDTPPRRETRQGVAGAIGGRIARSHTELDDHGAYVYDVRGNGDGVASNAITGDHANRVTDYTPVVVHCSNATVRRLTPTECERLQAFPDGWTAQGMKPDGTVVDQADTPRYKQLGNAVCVNVVAWIARRIPPALPSLADAA